MAQSNVAASGMEKHLAGYCVGVLLLSFGFRPQADRKVEKGPIKSEQLTGKDAFVWACGNGIFEYSLVLESGQALLPYRTWNPFDILGNGLGAAGASCSFSFCSIGETSSTKKSKAGYALKPTVTDSTKKEKRRGLNHKGTKG